MDIVSIEINKVLQMEKKRLVDIKKSRVHVSSVEKTVKWIKGRLSVSKTKTQGEIKSKAVSNSIEAKDKSKLSQKSPRNKNPSGVEAESSNLQGKEELLI